MQWLLPVCSFPGTSTALPLQAGTEDLGKPESSIMELVDPTLCLAHVTSKCHLPYLITCHTPFYCYEPLSVQNSVKPGPTVCSATVFQVCASTSVCLEKFKYALAYLEFLMPRHCVKHYLLRGAAVQDWYVPGLLIGLPCTCRAGEQLSLCGMGLGMREPLAYLP